MSSFFSKKLIDWYRRYGRSLPWRESREPYRIWLSEVILQQTQVNQGLPYYMRFIEAYPDVHALAAAPETEVLKLWEGLGYYSRARNLHHTARHISEKLDGIFPKTYEDIRELKGVGDYTAAAIASIAYGEPRAVVDGNVYRVLARFTGLGIPIDSTPGKKVFAELARRLLDPLQPAAHNQAVMDLGALVCRPVNPDCKNCPLQKHCVAFASGEVMQLPVKRVRPISSNRYLHYFVIADRAGRIRIRRRESNDIWKGLYEFSLVESARETSEAKLLSSAELRKLAGSRFTVRHITQTYRHTLTHRRLHARFYVLKIASRLEPSESIPFDQLRTLAFPRLITRFLDEHDLVEIL